MILHAEDDDILPVELSIKVSIFNKILFFLSDSSFNFQLANIAIEKRDLNKQGNVTIHIFPGSLHYGHQYISLAPDLPTSVT